MPERAHSFFNTATAGVCSGVAITATWISDYAGDMTHLLTLLTCVFTAGAAGITFALKARTAWLTWQRDRRRKTRE